MRILLTLFLLLAAYAAQAQTSRFDLRVGFGPYETGALDMRGFMLENELNYRINARLTTGIHLGLGRSNRGVGETAAHLTGNVLLFCSPFGNDRRNDLRLGAGVGYSNASDAYVTSIESLGNQVIDQDYEFRSRSGAGFHLAIENTWALTE